MRIQALRGVLAPLGALGLAVSLTACAGPMGTVAGSAVGGAGWGAMKTGQLAYKGGKGGARVMVGAGRVVTKTTMGGARAVGEEFRSNEAVQEEAADHVGDIAQR